VSTLIIRLRPLGQGPADLADRAIIIEMPVIGERARRSEAEL
jgi:hypothetical protein